jgi:hypothetical protein
MSCIAVGQSTGEIYATGTKIDCLRTLQEKYPYHANTQGNRDGVTKPISTLLPETIIIARK